VYEFYPDVYAASIETRAYWPILSSDLDIFLHWCVFCVRFHRVDLKAYRLHFSSKVWERLCIDITGSHPKSSRSNCFTFTLSDHFAKWTEAIAFRNHMATTAPRVFMVRVFSRFGAPHSCFIIVALSSSPTVFAT